MHTGLYNHILSNVSVIFWSTPKRLKMAECLLPGLLSRRNYSWLVSIFFILLFVCCLFVHFIFVFVFCFFIIHCFNLYSIPYALFLFSKTYFSNTFFTLFCFHVLQKLLNPVSDFLYSFVELCYSCYDQWTNRSADQQRINRHLFQWSINHNYSLLGMFLWHFQSIKKNLKWLFSASVWFISYWAEHL